MGGTSKEDVEHERDCVAFSFCGKPAECHGAGVLNLFALFGHNDFVPVHRGSERTGIQRHSTAAGCYKIKPNTQLTVVAPTNACGTRSPTKQRVVTTDSGHIKQEVVSDDDDGPQSKEDLAKRIIEVMRSAKPRRQQTQPKPLAARQHAPRPLDGTLKPFIGADVDDVPITLPRHHQHRPAEVATRRDTVSSPILAAASLSRAKPSVGSAAFPSRGESSAVIERGARGASSSMPPPSADDRQAPSPSPAPHATTSVFDAPFVSGGSAKRSSSLSRAVAAAGRTVADVSDDEPSAPKKEKKSKKDKSEKKEKREKKEKHPKDKQESNSRSRSQGEVVEPLHSHQQAASVPPRSRNTPPQAGGESQSKLTTSGSLVGLKQPSVVSQSSSDPPSFLLPPQKVPSKRQRSPSTPPKMRPASNSFLRDKTNSGHSIDESPALGYTRVDTKLTQFSLDPSEYTDSD